MIKQTRISAYACEVIQSVKSSIDQRPFDKKNIMDFANDSGLGRNLLQKGFKHLFGCCVKEYQKKRRLEAATVMLDEDRLSVQQIACKCGYRSQSSFTRAFKDVYKVTPSEWRQRSFSIESYITDTEDAIMHNNSAAMYNSGAKEHNG